jgi:hypothetical protein
MSIKILDTTNTLTIVVQGNRMSIKKVNNVKFPERYNRDSCATESG